MLRILGLLLLTGRSLRAVLDVLAETFRHSPRPWFPEVPTVYRVIHLFSDTYDRLGASPLGWIDLDPTAGDLRSRARESLRALTGPARASPVVLAFHRQYHPRLLFSTSG